MVARLRKMLASEKEHKEYSQEAEELNSNIDALSRAIPAIEKGMSGSFLQTPMVARLRKMLANGDFGRLSDFDRTRVTAFLATDQEGRAGYAPASGEIVGILKQMKDEMTADLTELTDGENNARASFEELVAAKKKEIDAATKAIETKTMRVGDLSVEIVQLKNDLEETKEALGEDKVFLMNLEKNCDSKKKEWAERQKTRADEILAIQETIKILNDDNALELFKKTLPGPGSAALLQVDVTQQKMRKHALHMVKEIRSTMRASQAQLDLIALALQGKKVGFEKVIKLIDDMVVNLKKEQTDDDDKKEYCQIQIDQTEDKAKTHERNVADLGTQIADAQEGIETLTSEIAALKDGIVALDKAVADATEQRKEENAEYTELMSSNLAAKDLIEFAKNRLNKFYNPKLYKPPPKRE